MAQITSITSEALQATIRRLLPSQRGFGEDLQATNVITPIIDVTPTAEGSQLPVDLARSIDFSTTSFQLGNNTLSDVITTTGFYRVWGVTSIKVSNTGAKTGYLAINEGGTQKIIYQPYSDSGIANEIVMIPADFIVYIRPNQKLEGLANTGSVISMAYRQVADIYGNIVNPLDFTFE